MKQRLLIFFLFGLFAVQNTFAQNRKITGTVTGAEDGLPLPGVSVMVQGTKIGTLTGGDGGYVLNVPSNAGTLTFTFIGFTTKNLPITTSNTYNVKLASSTRQLTEVTVTTGYGVQSKKSFTGSTASVSGAENENKPFSSPLQALQGEVAGLNVSSFSGQPGANVQVRLRGVNSIGADANPLYVVDGMIINSGDLSRLTTSSNVLAGINENDIEKIEVLKDAAALSIYGARGSNGVIVITTKRGKAGKAQVRFDTEIGTTANLELPDRGKPANGDQFRTLFLMAENNASANYLAVPTNNPANNPFSATRIATDIATYGLNGRSNNWYDLVTKNGSQQQYNISVNGGSENTRVFTSAGYFKQDATTIASNLTRATGLINIDQTISKRINFTVGLNMSNVSQNTPSNGGAFANPIGQAFFNRPFQLAYTDAGALNISQDGATNFPGTYNPLYTSANDVKHLSQTRGLGNVQLRWNIWDQLKYTGYVSGDYNALEEHQFNNPIHGDGASVSGRGYDYYSRYFNWLTRNQLDYRYDIPNVENFSISATVGYEAQKSNGYLVSAQGTGFPLTQPLLTALSNSSTPAAASGSFNNYTFDAIGGINFKNRYSLSGSFRRDGSSRFGANNKYGNFYSIGGAWNIDQEDFFSKQNILTTAKLRSSIGTTGNAGLPIVNNVSGNYIALPTAGYGFNYAGAVGQVFNTIGNTELTWESQQKFNVGADFGFFKDRLTFVVDYYRNTINGLIQSVPISRTTGFTTVTQNIGSMQNNGLELAVKGIPVRTKDFTWTTNFNIAFNQNTVTKLANGAAYTNGSFYVTQGRDLFSYYAREWAGVNPANGEGLWYTDGTKSATTNVYSAAQRVQAKQADPKGFGGFNNTFSYKGITLTADVYFNYGNYVNDGWASYLYDGVYYSAYNKYAANLDAWTTPGQVTDVPKYTAGGSNGGQSASFSTRFLYKGDFIRLRNASIGYDFKNLTALKKVGISRLYLYGRGTNILTKTFDKRLTFDPEVGASSGTGQTSTYGVSNLDVPQVKTFTIGLNVGF
jgi:TonB-linked SusC/RagA family outer membrane protein